MAFLNDVIFPTNISLNAEGGPVWGGTQIASDNIGREFRNQPWSYPLSEFDVSYGVRTWADLEAVNAIFYVAQGQTHTFRYYDHFDHKSCASADTVASDDATLLTATGGETEVQLVKQYVVASNTANRKITKPIDGTVLVEVDGVLKTEDTDYTVDYTTGVITFLSALSAAEVVKAGFQFHVCVRFDQDKLPIRTPTHQQAATSVMLVERDE